MMLLTAERSKTELAQMFMQSEMNMKKISRLFPLKETKPA